MMMWWWLLFSSLLPIFDSIWCDNDDQRDAYALTQSKDNDVHDDDDDDGWSKRHCCVELPALHWSTIIPVCRTKRESKQRLCDNNFKWRSNAQTHFYLKKK